MLHWSLILLLASAIILMIHPSHADYLWFQSQRRPDWLPFHVWAPIIHLLTYGGVFTSLVLVFSAPGARPWSMAIAHLLLIAVNQAALCFTCQTRRLKAGSLVGAVVTTTALALALAVHRLSPLAGLALVPFVLWGVVENLAQWQMMALNSGLESNRRTWIMRPQFRPSQPLAPSRRRGR